MRPAGLRGLASRRSPDSCGRERKTFGRALARGHPGCDRRGDGGRCTIVSDVGQHQMWVAKLFPYQQPNSHITSGGLGTMGFAVPAAMGVALARPDEPVWAISGDGGFQMNMQEIATMVQEGIPVKMAIFNNGYLGMVRQWQQFFHGRRYSATPIWSPDYVRLAEAYGIAGWRVESGDQLEESVRRATAEPGPALVEFIIEQEANVFPMIPPGARCPSRSRANRPPLWCRHERVPGGCGAAGRPSGDAHPRRRAHPAAKSPGTEPCSGPDRHAGTLEADSHDCTPTSDRRPGARQHLQKVVGVRAAAAFPARRSGPRARPGQSSRRRAIATPSCSTSLSSTTPRSWTTPPTP